MTENMKTESLEKRAMKHQLVIESNGENQTKISIDGTDFSDIVTEVKFCHEGGHIPVVKIELMGCNMSIRSLQIPQLPEVLSAYYKPVD